MLPVRVIQLTQGQYTIIDPEEWLRSSGYTWHANEHKNGFYACTNIPKPGGGYTKLYLHTLISGFARVDHENRDPLDNRKQNLRDATQAQNCMNRGRRSDNNSGHVGVNWWPRLGKWGANIGVDGSLKHLGVFADKQDAIDARHAAAAEYHGEFAVRCCPTD